MTKVEKPVICEGDGLLMTRWHAYLGTVARSPRHRGLAENAGPENQDQKMEDQRSEADYLFNLIMHGIINNNL